MTGAARPLSRQEASPCTPDQVADAMLDYCDLGITTFLIRGFDPLVDAIQYGRELIPRVRALAAARGVVAAAE